MNTPSGAALAEARRRYAAAIMHLAKPDKRVEAAFATVPREDFLTPPPWTVFPPGGFVETVTSDPADLYDDVLVVLDAGHGVNNGQPSLHAAWLAAVDPQPGETAVHVGTGTGYYTAILAQLVGPEGHVHGYELLQPLAERAKGCLARFDQVTVHAESGVAAMLPEADVVYVNASATAPDPAWLRALKPGGRLIFPWQPSPERGGVALQVTRLPGGFRADPTMAVGFIPCIGAQEEATRRVRRRDEVWQTRSLWLAETRPPDDSATAVYENVWFSAEPVSSEILPGTEEGAGSEP
jgi:protein-L-isoaspartate(D-aspartate) O-methyltransferase